MVKAIIVKILSPKLSGYLQCVFFQLIKKLKEDLSFRLLLVELRNNDISSDQHITEVPIYLLIIICDMYLTCFFAPAVTVGGTEGAMDSASVLVFISSFAYNFVRK